MKRHLRRRRHAEGAKVPSGPDWLHEIKHNGCRMMVIQEGKAVRLLSKGGLDWTKRFPWIVESALKLRLGQFVLDGEAVVFGVDGIIGLRCTAVAPA
jgi:ATP-dependent DNA ligase